MGENTLSETELYIMQLFWQHGEMKTDKLQTLVAEKNWKPTTLLTFLSRLVAKGMLKTKKDGKANLYIPLIEKQTYQIQEGQALLDELYEGSTQNFLAAMFSSKKIKKEELDELKNWLETQQE